MLNSGKLDSNATLVALAQFDSFAYLLILLLLTFSFLITVRLSIMGAGCFTTFLLARILDSRSVYFHKNKSLNSLITL